MAQLIGEVHRTVVFILFAQVSGNDRLRYLLPSPFSPRLRLPTELYTFWKGAFLVRF